MRTATVTSTERLTRDMVRVHLSGPDLAGIEPSSHTDRYVKLLFAPRGATYGWPFDPDQVREELPREQWPTTRTYTLRHLDIGAGRATIDFVVHGDSGLAGPWAEAARPGDTIGFYGPGGGWGPDPEADHHLLVGDESALPAIAASLDAMPTNARVTVVAEVADETAHLPLRALPRLDIHWVHRTEHDGAPGRALVDAVLALPWPEGKVVAFVHGNADAIRELRRYLLKERGLPRDQASISGYWRPGHDEDAWQTGKREFVAQMDAELGD